MTEAEAKAKCIDLGVTRVFTEHMQMLVMLTKCERAFASLGISAASVQEKAAALAMCREIKALRTQVES